MARSLLPSAEDATAIHISGWVSCERLIHVTPESVEVKSELGPELTSPTATSLVPSADEATSLQFMVASGVRVVHDAPAFVDVYIDVPATAASFVPSSDIVTAFQLLLPAPVREVHVIVEKLIVLLTTFDQLPVEALLTA